jgi:hypothetical protein
MTFSRHDSRSELAALALQSDTSRLHDSAHLALHEPFHLDPPACDTQGQRSATGIYVAVHGHFYQPPRENPYLNAIERQPSALPYHDWNERIHYECYRPNAFARVLSDQGDLLGIVNNYEYLSFNIGPTLIPKCISAFWKLTAKAAIAWEVMEMRSPRSITTSSCR